MGGLRWTSEEDQFIRASYPKKCTRWIATRLKRTEEAVQRRAVLLRVKKKNRNFWTAYEIHTLKVEWQNVGMRTLRKKLHGRSADSILSKAQRLGLPSGIPQGFETLTHASHRTGFSVSAIRSISEAWNRKFGVKKGKKCKGSKKSKKTECDKENQFVVRIRNHFASRESSIRPISIVESDCLDAALQWWQQLDTVQHAAERLRVDTDILRRLVRSSGKSPAILQGRIARYEPIFFDALLQGQHA